MRRAFTAQRCRSFPGAHLPESSFQAEASLVSISRSIRPLRASNQPKKSRADVSTVCVSERVTGASYSMDWRDNLISDSERIRELLLDTRTIAVLGIKTEAQAGQPAFYVPSYMQNAGFKIIPVPVYYPEVTTILGERVYRKLAYIPVEVDMVNVFRRPQDIPPHLEDILAKKPKSVWLQLGISHDAVAEELAKAGIKVVQDRCLMVDHRRLNL